MLLLNRLQVEVSFMQLNIYNKAFNTLLILPYLHLNLQFQLTTFYFLTKFGNNKIFRYFRKIFT